MKPRRVFGVAAVVGLMGCAIGVACTFPTVEFQTGVGPGGEGGTDGGADSTLDSRDDARVVAEGGDPDAMIVKDGGMKIDASGCVLCDCDKDGFNVKRAGCQDAGGAIDCDDTDTRARPDQGYLVDKPEPPQNGNWNCTNGVEKFYKPNTNCTGLGAGAGCDATYGFEDDPVCGTNGKFVMCKTVSTPPLNLDARCVVGSQNLTTTQACK